MYRFCNGTTHVVMNGDTLYNLSRQYGIPLAMILKANPFVDVYNLQVGSRICIPTGETGRPPSVMPEIQPFTPERQPGMQERQPFTPERQPGMQEGQPFTPGRQPAMPQMSPVMPGMPSVAPGSSPIMPGMLPTAPEGSPDMFEVLPSAPERQPVMPGMPSVAPGRQPLMPERPVATPERIPEMSEAPEGGMGIQNRMNRLVMPVPVQTQELRDGKAPMTEEMERNKKSILEERKNMEIEGMKGVPVYEYEVKENETLNDILEKNKVELEVFLKFNGSNVVLKKGIKVYFPKK